MSSVIPVQRPRLTAWKVAGVAFLIAVGVILRVDDLASPTLWVDEVESTVNALTILENGVPVDHYLGLPLYENTLVRPWPESEEYEFKDDSYSDKGVAVYHSWLPLYSIAASLYLFGIEPDRSNENLEILHPAESFAIRTLAPRVPSILFSVLFLFLLFLLGRALYGEDAAFAALVGGSLSNRFVWLGRQARYYSATLAFTALCGWAIWRAAQSERRRDFLLVGISLALLFHCHTLSFLILGAVFAAMIPFMLRRPKAYSNILLAGMVALAGTLPWILSTGFLNHAVQIPKAWTLLSLPRDLISFPLRYKALLVPCLLVALLLMVSYFYRSRIPSRFLEPFRGHFKGYYFTGVWLSLAYLSYTFLIPAASYFDRGVAQVVSIPGLLLTSLALAALWRGVAPRLTIPLTVLSMGVLLFSTGRISGVQHERNSLSIRDWKELDTAARSWRLSPGTRIYCSPNNHFLPMYYLGLPVQSIAPIRRSFLESFDKDLVILEKTKRFSTLPLEEFSSILHRLGPSPLEPRELAKLQHEVLNLAVRLEVSAEGARVQPPPREPSPLERNLIEALKLETEEKFKEDWGYSPIFRGQRCEVWTDWWPIFWYRFVDPDSRRGKNLNYAGILPEAKAWVLPCTWVIYEWDRDGVPLMDSLDSLYANSLAGVPSS